MFKQIEEGNVKITVPKESKISKDLPVFYNPIMEYNRTTSIALLNALGRKDMTIALPLTGTGVRAVRFLKELEKGMIRKLHINDYDDHAIKIVKKNLKLNNIKLSSKKPEIIISKNEANRFLTENSGFDYIDIDPFGSPNPFLDKAVSHLKKDGILAVTATDTSCLCGTYKNTCIRKYWATPLHTEEMHEVGLRILIRKVQLIGMQYEKALIPILSYDKDHYMRVFLVCKKSKKECDNIAKQHKEYKGAGPIWIGNLKNKSIAKKLLLDDKFSKALKEELEIIGFYEIPQIYKKEKIGIGKKIEDIIKSIKKLKYKASRTHFSGQGIKSNIPYDKLVRILKKK